MQSQDRAHNIRAEVRSITEPLPQHADANPLVQTSTRVPRQRLTTRELARRRRQRLLELLQQQAKQPASQEAAYAPTPSPIKKDAAPSYARGAP
jgi:hypothetical protein